MHSLKRTAELIRLSSKLTDGLQLYNTNNKEYLAGLATELLYKLKHFRDNMEKEIKYLIYIHRHK